MKTTQRECCNYCMWYGPINKDGSMRKHRPALDDGTVGGRKVQDMSAEPCPGSNKPFARFGCEDEPKKPVKVKFSLSDETRRALREQGEKARAEFRARSEARRAAERARFA